MPEPMTIDYNALADALVSKAAGQAQRLKALPSSTPTTTYGHGQGGLFSAPGLSKQVFSAMILPQAGLASLLPVRSSRETNPLYGIITGQTATTGTEPVGVCDDPPVAGLTKLCTHTFVFGRQSRMSRVFDIDRAGLITNRGEFTDLQVLGGPDPDRQPFIPTIANADLRNAVNTEAEKALREMAVAWSRDFAKEFYTGNPANNTSGGGRKYYYGLDSLINTGYRDAETGVACAAADSTVRSFGNLDLAANGGTLVRTITNIYRNLRIIAKRAGLDPVEWAISMPWAMFYELTEVWPCSYLTYRCSVTGNNQVGAGASDLITMRDDMRGDIFNNTGQYLLIDGQKVRVVLDDAIDEPGVGAGTFRSSIYFVPLRVLGNTPVTFWEHVDYDMPGGAMDMARVMAPDGQFATSDGGRFLWHRKPANNFCVQMLAKTEPRLLLLTPFLAARLTNVQYTPIAHERSGFTDSAYFVNGGSTDRAGRGPSYYSPTA